MINFKDNIEHKIREDEEKENITKANMYNYVNNLSDKEHQSKDSMEEIRNLLKQVKNDMGKYSQSLRVSFGSYFRDLFIEK